MFTGIIEEVGAVQAAADGVLRIRAPLIRAGTRLGESIAINGVDLTVMELTGDVMAFNVMPETYRRSNLASLRSGDAVNLERALRASDRLSGHFVRGVVEATGTLRSLTPEAGAIIATYETPSELMPYIVVKGPICVDGASLTVIAKTETTFAVSLVQYTQEHTNLLRRQPGDTINLETDILARYVGELLEARGIVAGS